MQLSITEKLAWGGVAVTAAVAGGLGLMEKPVLAHGAQGAGTCVGSKTVEWTDAIRIFDPDTGTNSKVLQFKRRKSFPCFVNDKRECVHANPQNTEIVEDESGGIRLKDIIPFIKKGCRFVRGR